MSKHRDNKIYLYGVVETLTAMVLVLLMIGIILFGEFLLIIEAISVLLRR